MRWLMLVVAAAASACAPKTPESIYNSPEVLKAERQTEATFEAMLKKAKTPEERREIERAREVSREFLDVSRQGEAAANDRTSR